MKMIERIVAAIDFSIYSPRILEYASGIAERSSAEIVAVNVINRRLCEALEKECKNDQLPVFLLEEFINDETKRRLRKLNDLMSQWVSSKVSVRGVVRRGVPFEQILQVLDDERADLLIVNSRGRTNFGDYMYGTTSEKTFRHSPVSVLSLNLRD
jgi:nucleotide-binding universal stress UspA family protein